MFDVKRASPPPACLFADTVDIVAIRCIVVNDPAWFVFATIYKYIYKYLHKCVLIYSGKYLCNNNPSTSKTVHTPSPPEEKVSCILDWSLFEIDAESQWIVCACVYVFWKMTLLHEKKSNLCGWSTTL